MNLESEVFGNRKALQDGSPALTRRDFLKSAPCLAAIAHLRFANYLPASIGATEVAPDILSGWEHFRGSLSTVWDVWRTDMGESTTWQKVEIPHCFNAHDAVDPEQGYYEGPGWYRRKLQIRNPFENGRTILHFEGAGQKTEVFVAQERAGEHIGGYDAFDVDISDMVAKVHNGKPAGEDVLLAVLSDNSRDSEIIPSALNDFHRFGGLYRSLMLVYTPAISLGQVRVAVEISSSTSARVQVKVRLRNPERLREELQLQVRILDSRGALVRTADRRLMAWDGEQVISDFKFDAPELWSPAHPALYRCEVQAASARGTSSLTERFGFRYFEFVDHGPFKLNGKDFYLKGTQREEDHAGVGPAMPESLIRHEIELIKEMGANFLGLAHHQQSQTVLDLCDELGLLVLEAIPWSRGGLGDELYKQRAREMLRSMVDQHYNHPSVILWGVGNENDWPGDFPDFNKDAIRGFVTELNGLAHELDPGRKTFLRRCDFARELVDVYSPSLWAGWYHGPYTQYRDKLEREMSAVPHFLHVEWGAEGHAGRHSEDVDRLLAKSLSGQVAETDRERILTGGQLAAAREGDWSETYACNVFDWHLKEQEKIPQLSGAAQWIFKDFSTPLRPNNPIPHVNQKGLTQRDLTPKEGYYVFQSYWSEKPMIRIYGHTWPIRWGKPDESKLVKVYSNCATAELFLNGISQGVRKRNSQEFPAAGLRWMVKLQVGENHLKALGHAQGAMVEDELALRYALENWGIAQHLELRESGRMGEIVAVEARLMDTDGRQCLTARDRVRFGLTGDGLLLDNLGTTKGSRSIELANGRAEILVSTKGGKSAVSARVATIPAAFLTVS